ncbi:hypothetical protein MKW94_020146, partial [Papaver nudicaule]|nr:hypothetical protein [Papaver nudicaule]
MTAEEDCQSNADDGVIFQGNERDTTSVEEKYLEGPLPRTFPPDAEYDSDVSFCYSEEVFGEPDVGDLQDLDDEGIHKDRLLDVYG